MKVRQLTGRAVFGAALVSMLLVACGSEGGASAPLPGEPLDRMESTSNATRVGSRLRADGLLPGMKRRRTGIEPAVAPQCSNPRLAYFGGPILQSPVIVAVFWNSDVNAAVQANMGQFFADVTQSSYWSWLQEYDTVGLTPGSQQAILPGSSGGSVTLTPSRCPAGATATCNLTDAQLQTELAAQIASGALPAPTLDCTGNANTIYMVSFPHNINLGGPDGIGRSCVAYCAYHNTGTYGASNTPLVYAALMDEFTGGCATGCGTNATPLENTTDTASHELVEAVTDTDIGLDTANNYAFPAGWADNNNGCGEIGDICDNDGTGDTITVNGRSWVVQELWSNAQGKCTSTGPALSVCTGTTLTGCRKCSCGDTGLACNGSTSVCETTSTNVLFGGCEQCTATSGTCTTGTCQQSSTPAQDDICTTCTPITSCPTGDDCGTVSDGCGGTLNCGSCTSPQTCGGGTPSNPNQCGCTPLTTCPAGDDCGTAPDGCGGMIDCGTCNATQTCSNNQCVSDVVDSGGGSDASTGGDAGATDAGGTADAGAHDSGMSEAGANDAATSSDSGTLDSGAGIDSGATTDSGALDSGSIMAVDGAIDANEGEGGEGGEDGGGANPGNSSGCGCHTAQSSEAGPSPALLAFGALALVGGLRFRRRRRVATHCSGPASTT